MDRLIVLMDRMNHTVTLNMTQMLQEDVTSRTAHFQTAFVQLMPQGFLVT